MMWLLLLMLWPGHLEFHTTQLASVRLDQNVVQRQAIGVEGERSFPNFVELSFVFHRSVKSNDARGSLAGLNELPRDIFCVIWASERRIGRQDAPTHDSCWPLGHEYFCSAISIYDAAISRYLIPFRRGVAGVLYGENHGKHVALLEAIILTETIDPLNRCARDMNICPRLSDAHLSCGEQSSPKKICSDDAKDRHSPLSNSVFKREEPPRPVAEGALFAVIFLVVGALIYGGSVSGVNRLIELISRRRSKK